MATATVDISYGKTPTKLTFVQLVEVLSKAKIDVIHWLQTLTLLSSVYLCPTCESPMELKPVQPEKSSDGFMWKCSRTVERRKHQVCRSIRKKTFFDNSNMRLEEIVQIIYFWALDYPQKIVMHELMQLGWHSVVDWFNFCRDVCVELIMNRSQVIGGPGKIVEIDESKFGKRKYNRGRLVEGQWVFGGVERESGDCFMLPVDDRSSNTLLPLIQQYVRPGTMIYSDCWKAYDCLQTEGYLHLTVNHSIEFVNSETGCHTNRIEGLWCHAKRRVPVANRQKSLFLSYMAEFIYRKKYLVDSVDHFHTLVEHIGQVYPPATHD